MRTTISIDDRLLDEIRRRAAELRTTVSKVIEDSVRESLLRHQDDARSVFRVRSFRGGGYRPGVDLDDNAAVLESMEGGR